MRPVNYEDMPQLLHERGERAFSPEFINRIDEIVVFHNLDRTHLASIFDLMVKEISDRLVDQKIHPGRASKAAQDYMIEKGFDEKFGARPLRRLLQKEVEDPLSLEILKGRFTGRRHDRHRPQGRQGDFPPPRQKEARRTRGQGPRWRVGSSRDPARGTHAAPAARGESGGSRGGREGPHMKTRADRPRDRLPAPRCCRTGRPCGRPSLVRARRLRRRPVRPGRPHPAEAGGRVSRVLPRGRGLLPPGGVSFLPGATSRASPRWRI